MAGVRFFLPSLHLAGANGFMEQHGCRQIVRPIKGFESKSPGPEMPIKFV